MVCHDFVYGSSTICRVAGEDMGDISNRAVALLQDGRVVLAEEGKTAIGLALCSTGEVESGDLVTILVKDIGLILISSEEEAVDAGDLLTVDEFGCGKVATAGDVVFGRAFTAGTCGSLVQVQILSCGTVYGG